MSRQPSLSDRFVYVMAEIRAVAPDDDDPMRYAIWRLQEQAENVMSAAIATAQSITDTARTLSRDHRKAVEDAIAAIPQHSKE